MVELVDQMESLSPSKEAHYELCNLLNIPSLTMHPDYVDWTVAIGRFECFNVINSILRECQVFQIGGLSGNEPVPLIDKRRAP